MNINRATLMKIHTLLAVFLLPVAIMFFVTGALYIWEIKGDQDKYNHKINLNSSFSGELTEYILMSKNKLNSLSLPTPTGKPKFKEKGEHVIFEWPGTAIEVNIKTNSELNMAEMEIKKASWYRHLVQLHKSKGGFLFKIYATFLSIALLMLLLTGFIMAWQIPKLRKLTVVATISGFMVFLLLVTYN